MTKQALITGGTGFIGKALCCSLLEKGYALTVLSRSPKKAQALLGDSVTVVSSFDEVDEVAQFDVVINLSGEPIAQRWTDNAKKKILNSRVGVTKDLCHLLSRLHHKPDVFISGSAIGWYGTDAQMVFDETSAPAGNASQSFARQVCSAWEDEAIHAEGLNIRTVLLRIGVVLEKDGGSLKKLFPPFFLGLGGPIGHGKQWFSWVDRDDLISIIHYIIEKKTISGPVNAVSPNPVSNGEFSKSFGRALKRPAFMPLPAFVLKFGFGQMAEEIMLQGQRVLPQVLLNSGYKFRYAKIEKSLEKITK